MGKLAGRTAIVTGGANGIGRGIAEAFAREGADGVVADIATSDQAQPVIEAIRQAQPKAMYFHTNVPDETQDQAMVNAAMAAFGNCDILVHNAGIFTQSLVMALTVAD